jgi:Zn-dependent protease with chaperone function
VAPAPVAVPQSHRDTARSDAHAGRRRALAFCAGVAILPALIVGIILFAVAGPVAGVIGLVVVAAAGAGGLWWGSTSVALRRMGARDLRRREEPRLVNVTQGLCATMGLAEPFVMAIDDDVPNACAVGRGPSDAVVVLTTGLIGRLDLVELEGVIAHELAHVRRGDTSAAGVVLAWCGGWCRVIGGGRWVHGILGSGREYAADQIAVAAVRYPPGLRDALARLRPGAQPSSGSVFRGSRWEITRWAWIDPTAGDDAATAGELDDTAVRIEALDQY